MSKVKIDVDQLRQLLVHARAHGTIDAWIRLAMEWAEEASKEACKLRDELAEYKRAKWTNEDIAKALAMRGDSITESSADAASLLEDKVTLSRPQPIMEPKPGAQISGATPLQEKVVCVSCGNTGYIRTAGHPLLNGYPCPDCNVWYKGSR